jgi:hypothetical protein
MDNLTALRLISVRLRSVPDAAAASAIAQAALRAVITREPGERDVALALAHRLLLDALPREDRAA